MTIQEKVKHFIAKERLLSPADRVLVALSGGADSVALLRLMQELGFAIEAAHCNFQLRGEESLRDEAFVQRLCQQRGVRLHTVRFDTRATAAETGQSLEMAARQLRYDYFETLCQQEDIAKIAVAHHREDSVETLLLNLVRGTGLQGLCGIAPKNGRIVRPLLALSRTDIEGYLQELGQDFVTDSTNLTADFARNKVRLQVLPMLRELNAAADDNILTTMENLSEVRKIYRYATEELISAAIDSPEEINIGQLLRSPSPLAVLHEILAPFGFRRSQIIDLLRSIRHVGAVFASASHRVCVGRETLAIEAAEQTAPQLPEIVTKRVPRTPDFAFNPSPRFAYFDAEKLDRGGAIAFRLAAQGDAFVPLGMTGRKLVSDLLTDLKRNRFEKERQFVMTCGSDVAWVVGLRTSNLFRVDEHTKEVCVMELTGSAL